MNGTIVQALANLANQDDNVQEWDHYLEAALLAIRTMPNVSTSHSAAKLLYSYDLQDSRHLSKATTIILQDVTVKKLRKN
jgi:hypothetical protein